MTSVPEPVLFGRSHQLPAPSPPYVHKTDEILNDILFVSFHIDKRLFKKRILINGIFLVRKK